MEEMDNLFAQFVTLKLTPPPEVISASDMLHMDMECCEVEASCKRLRAQP